jgi:hypothetical protein
VDGFSPDPWGIYEVADTGGNFSRSIESIQELENYEHEAKKWVERFSSPIVMDEHEMGGGTWAKDPRMHKPNLLWRGQACRQWGLNSSAQRWACKEFIGADFSSLSPQESLKITTAAEKSLREFEQTSLPKQQSEFPDPALTDVEIIALSQHQSARSINVNYLKTRLIDVTSRAAVALYFATEECPEHGETCDGRMLAIDPLFDGRLDGNETIEELAEEIGYSWVPPSSLAQLHPYLEAQDGAFLVSGYLNREMQEAAEEIFSPDFGPLPTSVTMPDGFEMPIFAGPADLLHEQLSRQQDVAIRGLASPLIGVLPFASHEPNHESPLICQSVRVSGAAKRQLRDALNELGVNEDSLFPKL